MLHRTSQRLEVSVCDSGPGIPETEQQRIFLDRCACRRPPTKPPGMGGLAVCRRIVEVHGGKIWVVSTLERGPASPSQSRSGKDKVSNGVKLS